MSLLILPGTELYAETLANSHLFLRSKVMRKTQNAQIQDSVSGLYREANAKEVFDYFYGGEYEETLDNYGD
jgi:hypothetical protein